MASPSIISYFFSRSSLGRMANCVRKSMWPIRLKTFCDASCHHLQYGLTDMFGHARPRWPSLIISSIVTATSSRLVLVLQYKAGVLRLSVSAVRRLTLLEPVNENLFPLWLGSLSSLLICTVYRWEPAGYRPSLLAVPVLTSCQLNIVNTSFYWCKWKKWNQRLL